MIRATVYFVTDPTGGGQFAEQTVRDAEASGNPHQLAHAYSGLVAIAAGQRDGDRARQAFIQAQHWSNVAGNNFVPTIAPLFLAMASSEDEPLEALSLVRDVLVAFDEAGTWVNLDFALRRVVMPLVRIGRHQSAAVLLGGMTSLTTSSPDTQHVVPRASATLADSLGTDLERLLDDGRALTRHQLVRLALDEIDICFNAS